MSQEELELVTRAVRAATARPKPDFATLNEVFHPDHVFVPVIGQIDAKEYEGARGYQQFLRQEVGNIGATDAALTWETDFEGAVDAGNHRVVTVSSVRLRGSASGVEFEQRIWTVMTVRDGQVVRTESYTDPTEAFRAALSE
jgi:ketosteroid isomerase-like protein